jgi:hypothetical protein
VEAELLGGILREATFACSTCVSWLPKRPKFNKATTSNNNSTHHNNDTLHNINSTIIENNAQDVSQSEHSILTPDNNSSSKSPPLALVNGHFRGRIPPELLNLNRTELSMICLINCVYTLSMLKPGAHYGSTGTVFSIVNDVHSIAANLPRMPTLNEVALMRSTDSDSPAGFEYSPHKILTALLWLGENNFMYENKFARPLLSEWRESGQIEPVPVPFISITAEDCEGLTGTSAASGPDGHPVNPSALDSDFSEVLLVPTDENRDLFYQVAQIVETNSRCELCLLSC